jgi:hypothetical protein
MKQIWKWIMHLNAKAFCLIAATFFFAAVGWSMYLYMTPPKPIIEGDGELPKPPEPLVIGTINLVDNQLAWENVSVPVDPFLPALDALDPTARAELIKRIEEARNNQLANNRPQNNTGRPQNIFDTVRTNAPPPVRMITPQISFLGYIKRPDGSEVAMFYDSSDKSTVFYSPGKTVHGLEILSADMREAVVKFPDGSQRKLLIGGEPITLDPIPDPNPPPPPPAAVAAPAANQRRR